ncbi:GGDEF domain-containing protein [Candidatus Woesearchaeota archaeon]|nr:GGDEF domain-containing protein [Candidatus Woesearchaeota archaeon]
MIATTDKQEATDLAALFRQMYSARPDAFTEALETLAREERMAVPQVYDRQTGLFGKQYFEQRLLPEKLAQAATTGKPVCYAIIDIDNFHQYNAQHGHQEGDKTLENIANIIFHNTRHEDSHDTTEPRNKDACAGRIGGGEEFGVILSTNLDGAYAACERLRAMIKTKTDVTVSIGIAVYDGKTSKQELIRRADKALFEAKENGRNQTRMYSPSELSPSSDQQSYRTPADPART